MITTIVMLIFAIPVLLIFAMPILAQIGVNKINHIEEKSGLKNKKTKLGFRILKVLCYIVTIILMIYLAYKIILPIIVKYLF